MGIMENKMETAIVFRVQGLQVWFQASGLAGGAFIASRTNMFVGPPYYPP